MALFKIFGNFASGNTTLPTTYTQGYCYFDKNTGKFWVDTTNAAAGRMALNAEKADKDSDGKVFSATYVKGPASATNGAIATYNGTGGKTIQNSAKTITTSAPTSSATDSTIPTSKAVWSAISGASGYGKTGTVTSITLKAGGGITLDTDNTAITSSGTRTISHKDTSSVSNLTANGRTYVTGLTFDTYGHVTAYTTGTETVTNSDTKNTAGSTDTSSKIYLIGATSQAANPQTYSDNQIYATNGQLDANKVRVAEAVSLVYDTTLQALNFVFA